MHELNHETIDAYCLSRPGASVDTPFGPDTLVYKVGGKMFALLSMELPRISLKCDPAHAIALRDEFEAVTPGYHLSKVHWNSVCWEVGDVSGRDLAAWIDDSYGLVLASLPKAARALLLAQEPPRG